MPKKRKSGGRAKGGKGHSDSISCSNCGTLVPKDKAKKKTGRVTLVEPTLARELRAAGTYIATQKTIKYYLPRILSIRNKNRLEYVHEVKPNLPSLIQNNIIKSDDDVSIKQFRKLSIMWC